MRNLLLIVFVFINCYAKSQDTNDLDKKNGFQGIYLNSPLSLYESFIPVEKYLEKLTPIEKHNQELMINFYDYIYTGKEHSSIGDFKIKYVLIEEHKVRIHKVKVICECNDDLLKTILIKYGKPLYDIEVKDYEDGKSHYYMASWEGEKVNLTLIFKRYYNVYDSYNSQIPDLISLEYTSRIINEQIKTEKEEKRIEKMRKAYNDF